LSTQTHLKKKVQSDRRLGVSRKKNRSQKPALALMMPAPLLNLPRPRFLLVGDSITQQAFSPVGGWGARLADAYARRADVVLRGYSGYTSEQALSTLAGALFPPAASSAAAVASPSTHLPPSLITLWFGANDAALPGPDRGSAAQHVPLARYEANMEALARRAAGAVTPGSGRVLVITPPPVHEPSRALHAAANYGAPLDKLVDRTLAASGQYAAAACRAAAAAGVGCLDMWTLLQEAGRGREAGDGGGDLEGVPVHHRRQRGAAAPEAATPAWASLLSDGLHFSPAGQEVAFNAISAAIAQHAAHLAVDALPLDAPEWGEVAGYVPSAAKEEEKMA